MWWIIEEIAKCQNSKNLQDLARNIDEILNGLSLEYLKTLMGSMKNRIESSTTLKEQKIDY